jgi:glycosyltransferase involved in cell wall biosynthesis
MRVVVDFQAGQTPSSRHRGIGRYSMALLKAMLSEPRGHELLVVLNGAFGESVDAIRAELAPLLPQENIRLWFPSANVPDTRRRRADMLLREAFIASLKPDIVHVTSLFEGLSDVAATSISMFSARLTTAVTLYDLIPYIHRRLYLPDPGVAQWYMQKVAHLRRADLLLGISESARTEAVEHLGIPTHRTVNISSDVDEAFRVLPRDGEAETRLRRSYGLNRPFVMYTGGIDHRKNIEGLIRAYARLPEKSRAAHQLAVVCSANEHSRRTLEQLAREQGLSDGDLVMTGFVPEPDLVALYNLCTLFVFPSWHEGFGLPALEAMRCGAPVIASSTSSLPEVVGRADALFDPHDDCAIAAKMEKALTDDAFRADLVRHGQVQAQRFSWADSARRTLEAFERTVESRDCTAKHAKTIRRPRMAFVSPLPPERSGIADYSAQLLPDLARHYDIVAITPQRDVEDVAVTGCCEIRNLAWFRVNAARFDRIVYQFGNSHFHQHMFDLLAEHPGVVVLHDFFLSGIEAFRTVGAGRRHEWAAALYRSHGYAAIAAQASAVDPTVSVYRYPCNFDVLRRSIGTIVHSPHSVRLGQQWYGDDATDGWSVIPLVRRLEPGCDRLDARRRLGIGAEDFVVCSFGHLGATKQNHRLLDAWTASALSQDPRCRLVFVGESPNDAYGASLARKIACEPRAAGVKVSGWTDAETFALYLAAADVAVQLRTLSRGETSAAVLDCMGNGLPTIVNANGSMADLPCDAVVLLPDEFSDVQLVDALESLFYDEARRVAGGAAAKQRVVVDHAPVRCADLYAQAIERYYEAESVSTCSLAAAVGGLLGESGADAEDFAAVADAIARSLPAPAPARQLLVDVTGWDNASHQDTLCRALAPMLRDPPAGFRVEPVEIGEDGDCRYARSFAALALDLEAGLLPFDELADIRCDDLYVVPAQCRDHAGRACFVAHLRRMGVGVEQLDEAEWQVPVGA